MDKNITTINYLIKNSSITSFFSGCSFLLSLLLDGLILTYFGLGIETDAFFIALSIPMLITSTLEEQLQKVMVPIFISHFQTKKKEYVHLLMSNVITNLSIILLFICVVCISISKNLISAQVTGSQKSLIELSANLSLVLFWLIFFHGSSAILQSLLFSYHQYFTPALRKMINLSITILLLIILKNKIGIYAVVIGYLIGSICEFIFLFIDLKRKGFKYKFVYGFKDSEVKRLFKLSFYPITSHILYTSKILVENYIASLLGGGSVSIIRYADRIVRSIMRILLGGILTTSLSLMSHYSASDKINEMKDSVLQSVKILTFIAFPVAIWLIFTGNSLLLLFSKRGQAIGANISIITNIMGIMLPGLIFGRINSIIESVFFARINMRIPYINNIILLLLNLTFIIPLSNYMGIYGLSFGFSLATFFGMIIIGWIFHFTYGSLGWQKIMGFEFKLIAISIIMAFSLFLSINTIQGFKVNGLFDKLVVLGIPSILGILTFLLASIFLGMFDLEILQKLRVKLVNKAL